MQEHLEVCQWTWQMIVHNMLTEKCRQYRIWLQINMNNIYPMKAYPWMNLFNNCPACWVQCKAKFLSLLAIIWWILLEVTGPTLLVDDVTPAPPLLMHVFTGGKITPFNQPHLLTHLWTKQKLGMFLQLQSSPGCLGEVVVLFSFSFSHDS